MKILVTGHLGYIGTVMVPLLQAEGHEIVGLDSDLFRECTFGDFTPDVPHVSKDIRDVESSDLRGFDAVIHLAALSNDPLGNFNPELTNKINYDASVNLARLAKKAGVSRFIFSSSCSVYGSSNTEFLTEESEPHPITPYAVSKYLVEKKISQMANSNFSPTFLRSATAYGVSPKLRSDLVLNNLTAWAYTTNIVLLKSDGLAWRPIVHIEDISRAFIAVLNASRNEIHNQIFNVGQTKENYQIRELANIVKEIVPGSKVKFEEGSGPDKRSYRVDFNKISNILSDFEAKWNARKGVKQLYDAYKKIGFMGEDFEGPRFRRLKHLQRLLATNHLDATLRWRMND